MANSFVFKENNINIGDTINLVYKIKEGEKERQQTFSGIIIKIKGSSLQNKMITVRKTGKSGVGVERIIPLNSPFLAQIKVTKKGFPRRSKLYFIRKLSDQEVRHKIYHHTK